MRNAQIGGPWESLWAATEIEDRLVRLTVPTETETWHLTPYALESLDADRGVNTSRWSPWANLDQGTEVRIPRIAPKVIQEGRV